MTRNLILLCAVLPACGGRSAAGPTLSADGHSLYFHRMDNGTFAIYRATR